MADLAELRDMVEGLRAAAHKARQEGNRALADALEKTRFEVYERYLGELQQQGNKPSMSHVDQQRSEPVVDQGNIPARSQGSRPLSAWSTTSASTTKATTDRS
jgi:hypothetical protein